MVVLGGLTFAAQAQSGQQQTTADQHGAEGEKAGQPEGTSDTPGAEQSAAAANGDSTSVAVGGEAEGSSEAVSNTPAVPQTTTSQGGSPAVLADDDGDGRDGTNNVQRASMNMAGAPASNLQLDDKAANPDSEMKDRQDKTRDKAVSAGGKGNGTSPRKSEEINEESRRENNARSDQNLSSKEKEAVTGSDGKSKKKSKKRRKDRG